MEEATLPPLARPAPLPARPEPALCSGIYGDNTKASSALLKASSCMFFHPQHFSPPAPCGSGAPAPPGSGSGWSPARYPVPAGAAGPSAGRGRDRSPAGAGSHGCCWAHGGTRSPSQHRLRGAAAGAGCRARVGLLCQKMRTRLLPCTPRPLSASSRHGRAAPALVLSLARSSSGCQSCHLQRMLAKGSCLKDKAGSMQGAEPFQLLCK